MCCSFRPVLVALSITAILAGGCAAKRPAAEPSGPLVAVGLNHFTGTPLSGPLKAPTTQPDTADALALTIKMTAVRALAPTGLAPVTSRARMISVTRGSDPVIAVPQLAGRTRFADGQPAEAFLANVQSMPAAGKTEIHTFTDALIPGVTSTFDVTSLTSVERRTLTLQIHRPAGSPGKLQLGLWIQDQVVLPTSNEETEAAKGKPAPKAPPINQRELVLIDDLDNASAFRGVFFVPFGLPQEGDFAVVIDISAATGSTAEPTHAQAIARMLADLQRSADAIGARPALLPTVPAATSVFSTAIAAMQQPANRRSAMLFLATQNGAPLLEDLALVGDESTLAIVVSKITERTPQFLGPGAPSDTGWAMESIALSEVISLQSSGKLSQPLTAVVMRLYGEAGRNASSLQEVAKGLPARPEFQNRLVAENLIYLEDNSPSARIRAYDWLAARKLAPEGYDPLGPIKQRRDALEKALYSAPTTQGGAR